VASVEFLGVTKRYRDGTEAVSDLDLVVDDGEFLVLVGPSGCGKSTALRMVAGLEEITAGEVRIDGRRVNEMPPAKRDIAMVFQNYALYPHMTVRKNLEIGMKIRGIDKAERASRVKRVAGMLGIDEYLERKPAHLSGGQRQRVAMGRAIVRNPQVFLLDEPLSNLDAKLRTEVRADIKVLQSDLKTTTIFVTHDQVEAMTMAHRIAVLRKGSLQQVGTPRDLYLQPANLFVAGFIGSPAMNFLAGALLVTESGQLELRYGPKLTRWRLPSWIVATPELRAAEGSEIIIGVRPEHLGLADQHGEDSPGLAGRVVLVEALGSDTLVHLELDAPSVMVDQLQEALAAEDELSVDRVSSAGQMARSCVRLPGIVPVEIGSRAATQPVTGSVYFFDSRTGSSIAVAHAPATARG
jgi:multiple sugar transport system ATP-binding protein